MEDLSELCKCENTSLADISICNHALGVSHSTSHYFTLADLQVFSLLCYSCYYYYNAKCWLISSQNYTNNVVAAAHAVASSNRMNLFHFIPYLYRWPCEALQLQFRILQQNHSLVCTTNYISIGSCSPVLV